MKKALFLIVSLSVAVLLASCGGQQETEKNIVDTEESFISREPVVPEAVEPNYVYLPDDTNDSENLVFCGWITKEEAEAEKKGQEAPSPEQMSDDPVYVAKYQDVSENPNAIALSSVYGSSGDTVSIPVTICGEMDLCALDMNISYHAGKLRFAGFANVSEDVVVNCDESNGRIYLNFLRLVNLDAPFKLCDLTFSITSSDKEDVTLPVEVIEVVSLDEKNEITFCPFSIVDGIVHMNNNPVEE